MIPRLLLLIFSVNRKSTDRQLVSQSSRGKTRSRYPQKNYISASDLCNKKCRQCNFTDQMEKCIYHNHTLMHCTFDSCLKRIGCCSITNGSDSSRAEEEYKIYQLNNLTLTLLGWNSRLVYKCVFTDNLPFDLTE